MPAAFHPGAAWVAAGIATIVFMVLAPLALAAAVRLRLGVGWRYFGYGALIFFLFQVASRVPLTAVFGALLAPQLRASRPLLWTWLAILVATAAVFEEVGRYVGYRWLMGREEKTWNKAVMYGLGHGGLESMLLVAGLATATLVGVLVLSAVGPETVPPARRAAAEQFLALVAAQPWWFPILGAWERIWALAIQVALSVVVLQVFKRGSIAWLWLAMAVHALVDAVAVLPQALGPGKVASGLIVEAIVGVLGVGALWSICKLRSEPRRAPDSQPALL